MDQWSLQGLYVAVVVNRCPTTGLGYWAEAVPAEAATRPTVATASTRKERKLNIGVSLLPGSIGGEEGFLKLLVHSTVESSLALHPLVREAAGFRPSLW